MEQGSESESDYSTLANTNIVEQDDDVIEVGRADLLSPLDETLLDIGKDLIKSSIVQSREFHKTMLSLTATFSTLMASVFGVLVLGMSNRQLNDFQRGLLVVPVFLMLLSSVFFSLGYYPRHMELAIQDLTDINQKVEKVLNDRRLFALLGSLSFIVAIASLLGGIAFLNLR